MLRQGWAGHGWAGQGGKRWVDGIGKGRVGRGGWVVKLQVSPVSTCRVIT